VSAHAEVADVVEVDDSELAGWVRGFDEQCADEHVLIRGFVEDRGAKVVVVRFRLDNFRNGDQFRGRRSVFYWAGRLSARE
jgi:hypothetical protein